ncbi:hypothetical protein [Clostridium tertium]|uniref:hypothetical protein n=1 Tax=Clostridium tertium TaxID=1559 RepID=UPI001596E783|nr:hypothetical protein [Clostridium tertium]
MVKLSEKGRNKITNMRIFKYKGVVHTVIELKDDIKGFTGCYQKNMALSVVL